MLWVRSHQHLQHGCHSRFRCRAGLPPVKWSPRHLTSALPAATKVEWDEVNLSPSVRCYNEKKRLSKKTPLLPSQKCPHLFILVLDFRSVLADTGEQEKGGFGRCEENDQKYAWPTEAVEASKICSRVDISYTEIISFVCIAALTRASAPFLSSLLELLVEVHVNRCTSAPA